LRGMQPRDAGAARVLEVECGNGENLLAIAERYPGSTYLGIDSRARHVAMARQAARELGLANVEFRQADLRELGGEGGTFDYIIARGVYSAVPSEIGQALLGWCRAHLAPQGLAYVSYKTYPGWHLHDMFRAMMRYDAREATGTGQRTAAARALLEFLGTSC